MKIKTQNSMTPNIKLLTGIIAICLSAFTTGCSSTDVIDQPKNSEPKSQTITLNISCPDAVASTRADGTDPHSGHVLRYSAIVYTGSELKTGTFYGRQEDIVTSGSSKIFTFEVPNNQYSCIVFADYIPSTSQPDSEGLYNDKYYNTEDPRERIFMRSFIDFSTYSNGNTKVDDKCFNNENYDCFAYFEENIVKGDDEEVVEINLERIVSRVAFKSSTPFPENTSIRSIYFSKFDFFGTHTIKDKSINNSHHAGSSTLKLSGFSLDDPYDEETGELFFFYTFASPKDGIDVSLYEFTFTVNFDDNSTYETSVAQSKIKPTPNYKIIVTGPFLSAPETKTGNLILDIRSLDTEQWNKIEEVDLSN